MQTARATLALLLLTATLACGPTLTDAEARQQRQRLSDAMDDDVATREQRDRHSRLLAEVAESGALDGLTYSELRAAFGQGRACRTELCDQYGFTGNDWFYEIGRASGDDVSQLPVLMVAFDTRGRVTRVFTVTTH